MKSTQKNKEILMAVAESGLNPEFFEAVKLKDHHKPKIIPVKVVTQTIIINGISYQKIQETEVSRPNKSRMATALMAMASLGAESKTPRKRPIIDLEKEFELIQLKQSKLGRNDRDWVERMFYKKYKPI